MAMTIRCTGISVTETGAWNIDLTGVTLSFPNFQDMLDFATAVDGELSGQSVRAMLLRWWLQRDPGANNLSLIVGKELVFDMGSAEMIRVT